MGLQSTKVNNNTADSAFLHKHVHKSAFWGPPPLTHCGRHIWKPPKEERKKERRNGRKAIPRDAVTHLEVLRFRPLIRVQSRIHSFCAILDLILIPLGKKQNHNSYRCVMIPALDPALKADFSLLAIPIPITI